MLGALRHQVFETKLRLVRRAELDGGPRAGAERAARCGEAALAPAGARRRDRPLRHGRIPPTTGSATPGPGSGRAIWPIRRPSSPCRVLERADVRENFERIRSERGDAGERPARGDGRHHRRAAPRAARQPGRPPDARLAAASLVGRRAQATTRRVIWRDAHHRLLEEPAARRCSGGRPAPCRWTPTTSTSSTTAEFLDGWERFVRRCSPATSAR